MRYVIVGASHGGHEAALELLTQDPTAEVTIFEQGEFVSFMSCGMELYLTNQVKDPNTIRNFKPEDITVLGGHVENNAQVRAINDDQHEVTVFHTKTHEEEQVPYDKLIISSGVTPARLPVPGAELGNIYLMRGYDWARKLKAKLTDPTVKEVTIVGAGYIGIEAVESFLQAGKKVTLIDTLPRVLAAYLNQPMTDLITKRLVEHGVAIHTGEFVQAYQGSKGQVKQVRTDQGTYETDLVVEAIGVKPSTEWLAGQVALDKRGWIKTDPYLQTNLPDVYAIGDAILPYSIPAGQPMPIALATTARREAQYVVQTMNGLANKRPFKGVVGTSALSILNYRFATAGLNEVTAQRAGLAVEISNYVDQRRPYYVSSAAGNGQVMVNLVYAPIEHTLLGGAVLADQYDVTQLGSVLSLAISQRMTIEDLAEADFFFQPGFDRQWNVLNLAAQHALGYGDFTR